ncbi:flavin reductase family protein [Amycolatopsis thermophila]|uniref:Flavin reductase (DIM6/NTAB) family NADH-FMN oxidoreductase RutF n=1 Tax=Amycolatopsis thermophila TaxID=206084 RepID=A0ABU0F1F2_9PSEU|nr:flavin reductase family protein [Amycolatopsis thermophila]MDQ0381409.1 flavin reductase (DIM6/NTAB) family NADH-FMN oxidoreductase RutF [Amycolatopsis thermophila]
MNTLVLHLLSADPAERERALRHAFARFPTGVTALCALGPEGPVGMAASSFTSVSLDPALVSVCIGRGSTTWPRLAAAGRVGISVLGGEHAELSAALAARGVDRFAGATWEASPSGAVFLAGAPLWLECRIDRTLPAGDHDIVLFEVLGARVDDRHDPLIFHLSQVRALETR